jgi:hypothetical protein
MWMQVDNVNEPVCGPRRRFSSDQPCLVQVLRLRKATIPQNGRPGKQTAGPFPPSCQARHSAGDGMWVLVGLTDTGCHVQSQDKRNTTGGKPSARASWRLPQSATGGHRVAVNVNLGTSNLGFSRPSQNPSKPISQPRHHRACALAHSFLRCRIRWVLIYRY